MSTQAPFSTEVVFLEDASSQQGCFFYIYKYHFKFLKLKKFSCRYQLFLSPNLQLFMF